MSTATTDASDHLASASSGYDDFVLSSDNDNDDHDDIDVSTTSSVGSPLKQWKAHRDRLKAKLGPTLFPTSLASFVPLPVGSPQASIRPKEPTSTARVILQTLAHSASSSEDDEDDDSMEAVTEENMFQQETVKRQENEIAALKKNVKKERLDMQALLIASEQKLRQEKESLEQAHAQEIDEMKAVVQTLKDECQQYQKKSMKQQQEQDKLKIEMVSLTTRLKQRQIDYNGLLERHRSKETYSLEQSASLLSLSDKVEKYQGELLVAKKEIAILSARYQEKEKSETALNNQVATLENEVARAVDEREEAVRKLKDAAAMYSQQSALDKQRTIKLEKDHNLKTQKVIELQGEIDRLNDKDREMEMELVATRKRMTTVQEMFDKVHYDAERERKLSEKLKKAKQTIAMHRRQMKTQTLQLHTALDGVETLEQYRQEIKMHGKSSANFLYDLERLKLSSNTGKKLMVAAGYGRSSKARPGVFVNPMHPQRFKPKEDSDDDEENVNTPQVIEEDPDVSKFFCVLFTTALPARIK
jgi:hypothetical protein